MSETTLLHTDIDHAGAELSEAQATVIKLFELSDEEFQDQLPGYIERTAAHLSENVSKETVTDSTPSFSTFIPSDRPLFPAADFVGQQPLVLDDPTVYEAAITRTRAAYRNRVQRDGENADIAKIVRNTAITSAFEAQALYFGSFYGSDAKRWEILEQDGDSPRNVSVSELGDGAMCMERAGIVHNSLLLLGVPSEYCIGSLTKYDEAGKIVDKEGHAYLIVEGGAGVKYLFDPANPKKIEYPEQGIIRAKPNTNRITDDTATSFSFPWQRYVNTNDAVEAIPSGERHYTKNSLAQSVGTVALIEARE